VGIAPYGGMVIYAARCGHRALLHRLRRTIIFVILSFAKNLVFVPAH